MLFRSAGTMTVHNAEAVLVPVLSKVHVNTEGIAVGEEIGWRYPADGQPAPPGATVQLLTKGRTQCKGVWSDGGGFIAWAPNYKRDKELEERLGL